jgi:hypothetical protein
MFLLMVCTAWSVSATAQRKKSVLSHDTILLTFEVRKVKLNETSLGSVLAHSNEFFRSKYAEILIPAEWALADGELVEGRLNYLKKLLIQEGLPDSTLASSTLTNKKLLKNLPDKPKDYAYLIVSYLPYYKYARWKSGEPERDTVVNSAEGFAMRLNYRHYLRAANLPDVLVADTLIPENHAKNEFSVLQMLRVEMGDISSFEMFMPLPDGVRERQMLVDFSEDGAHWQAVSSISNARLGKTKAIIVPVGKKGFYRFGYTPQVNPASYVIEAPDDYSIKEASIRRKDGMNIDFTRSCYGRCIAFVLNEKPENYTLAVSLMAKDGRIIHLDQMALDQYTRKRVSDKHLQADTELRSMDDFVIPEYKFRILERFFANNSN